MPPRRSCPASRQPSGSPLRRNPSRSPGGRRSHPICLAGELRRMRTVGSRPVAAEPWSGKYFSWIEATLWVEGAPDPVHRLQVGLVEHLRHERSLVGAHAMLPGDRSAEAQTDAKNIAGDVLSKLLLSRHFGVVQNKRMEIAVAGVKDVGDPKSGLPRKRLDVAENFGDLRARDDPVLHDIVRADAADGGERTAASFPEQRSFVFVLRPADLQRTRGASHLDGSSGSVLDFSERPV